MPVTSIEPQSSPQLMIVLLCQSRIMTVAMVELGAGVSVAGVYEERVSVLPTFS